MKAILCFVLVAVASSAASPMFGASGMMRRRFPGAPDMTVRTYREITNNNAAAAAPPAAPAVARAGPTQQGSPDQGWMFSNSGPAQLAAQPTLRDATGPVVRTDVRPAVRPAPAPVSTVQVASTPASQNSVDNFQIHDDFPTSFHPRESYAHLDFPEKLPFNDYFGTGYEVYPKPIFMPRRHYY